MKLAGHNIYNLQHNSAQVGCTTVTRSDLMQLLREMDKVPIKKFPDMTTVLHEDYSKAIDLVRGEDNFHPEFMSLRDGGAYNKAGFFLGNSHNCSWGIVEEDITRNMKVQILIPTEDILHVESNDKDS